VLLLAIITGISVNRRVPSVYNAPDLVGAAHRHNGGLRLGTLRPHSVHRQDWPGYPTRLQVLADAGLLKRHMPAGRLSNRELAAAAGVFLAANVAGCDSGKPPAPPTESVGPPAAVPLVAPVFEHGEGKFKNPHPAYYDPWGHPAMAAYLPEEEALRIISEELSSGGLSMTARKVALDGVVVKGRHYRMEFEWVHRGLRWQAVESPGPLLVDLADPQRNVYIEFLTEEDYYPLGGRNPGRDEYPPRDGDPGWEVSHIELARQLTEQVRQQAGEIVFGVFYDPVVYAYQTTMEPEAKAQELLRMEVRDFVDWLKAQGVI
jgi:hypothetical protein